MRKTETTRAVCDAGLEVVSRESSRPTDEVGPLVLYDALGSIRKHQLLEHPLCKYCLERGIVDAGNNLRSRRATSR